MSPCKSYVTQERSDAADATNAARRPSSTAYSIAGIAALIVVIVFAFGGGARGLFHGSCSDIIEDQGVGSCP